MPSTNSFRNELQSLINRHCMENGSNTPDFILADYMQRCLDNFDQTVQRRDAWYGRTDSKFLNATPLSSRPANEG